MTIPIDTSKDWEIIEGLEPVIFSQRTMEGTYENPLNTQGKRMPLTKGEMQGDANFTIYGIVWYLWTDLLNGMEPKYSDKITDAKGNNFQIIKIDIVSLGNRYRLVCLREPPSGN